MRFAYKTDILDRRRLEMGLSLRQLAIRAGVSPNTARNVINGHSTREASVVKLAKALGISPRDIIASKRSAA